LSLQGKKFIGELQPDGRIVWQETGQVFNSPSAWATHCKKLVNPAKKSGCGWASVKYKGQKLDKYKAAWLRRHQLHMPIAAADEVSPSHTDPLWMRSAYLDTAPPGLDQTTEGGEGARAKALGQDEPG
jgi:hypothetical protein